MTVHGVFRGDTFPLIISAPSGAGKTTIARTLKERRGDISFSTSVTTRPPRANETDGLDYHFVSEDRFRRMIDGGELVEWAEVHGNLYGTPRANLEAAVRDARFLVLDIDVQGARQIRKRIPQAVSVFVVPPRGEVLVERLLGRGSERDSARRRRLDNARSEFGAAPEFDYVIVNDDLDRAVETLEAILVAEAHRPTRMRSVEDDVERLRAEVARASERLGIPADRGSGRNQNET